MGYVKKAYREIFRILDDEKGLPNGWNNFVEKQSIQQNLIIKSSKNKCYCANCNNSFYSKKKINQEVKCPYCHNKYLIKRSNLKYYEFKDYLSILDIVNNTFIIRYFELKTIIDALHERHYSVVEFAREIPTDNYYRDVYVNDRVSRCQCSIYIHHSESPYFDTKKWREYTRNYSLIDNSIVFPNNLKKLLKNTKFKYSCIWDIAKHSTYIDLLKLIKKKDEISLKRIELLAKMKLYNLALVSDEFKNEGSFNQIFGISKDYYEFMKKNNINYTELELLKLLKEKNIAKIKYLENFVNYGNVETLREISRYISLNRFIEYSKIHHKRINLHTYKDYLRFAKIFGLDLKNKKYIFPKDLMKEHDKLSKQYQLQEKAIINNEIVKRGKILSINSYKNRNFIITPAKTLNSLIDESKQQNNCVRTYAERYAEGECDIYFMRNINEPNKSLVTVEVIDNEIVQSRIKNNHIPNEKQKQFLQKWEQKILKGAA